MTRTVTNDGWRLTDDAWALIKPLLPARKAHPLGCHNPRVPDRDAMDAILLVLRTGCRWDALDASGICSCSSAYRRFREWTAAGVFEAMKRTGIDACCAMGTIESEAFGHSRRGTRQSGGRERRRVSVAEGMA